MTEWNFFSSKKKIEPTRTTVGIDIHDVEFLNVMKKTDLLSKMKITVWDFAGQLEYSVNHQVLSLKSIE